VPAAKSPSDGLLGRHIPQGEMPASLIDIADKSKATHRVPQTSDFIIPRGGRYFFAPPWQPSRK